MLAAVLLSIGGGNVTGDVGAAFDHLDYRDGLVNSSISAIVQDTDGFFWFGSQAGLHRYDGYSMEVISSLPFDPDSLSHHLVQSLYYADDALWVGTYNGLNRLDLSDYRLQLFPSREDDPYSLSNEIVTAVQRDAHGRYWVGTLDGLNRLDDPESGRFTRIFADPDDAQSLPHSTIRGILLDSRDRLWVGSYGGLSLLVSAPGSIPRFRSFDAADGFSASYVMGIEEDDDGILWIGTWDKGVVRFDPEQEVFSYPDMPTYPVYSLHAAGEMLYAGTWGNGMLEYHIPTGQYRQYLHDPLVRRSIGHNVIYSLFLDDSGILWIGTNGNGISRLNTHQSEFTLAHSQGDPDTALTPSGVRALVQLPEGDLLVGFQNHGIDRFREGEGVIRRYRSGTDNAQELPDGTVNDFLLRPDGTVLTATNGGLLRYYPDQDRFEPVGYNPDPSGDVNENIIYSLAEDRQGSLWIGTYTRGIVRRHPDGRLQRYETIPGQPDSLSNNLVYQIFVDSRGTVWAGTNGGLNRYLPSSDSWQRYQHDPLDEGSISNDSVSSFLEDSAGQLWVGTRAGGINRYDPLSDSFVHWSTADGLNSNAVMAIAESLRGELLIGTSNGMSVFDPNEQEFFALAEADGMHAREFSGAVLSRDDGSVVFGAFGQLVVVQDTVTPASPNPPGTLITDVQVQNRSIIEGNPNRLEMLEVSYRQNWLAFWFSSTDYTQPQNNRFRYRMQGWDEDWIEIEHRRSVEYTNLPPGRYQFQVQAGNSYGAWDTAVRRVDVVITPPFWQTTLFRAVLVLLILGLSLAINRYNTARLRALNQRLDEQVKERTRELSRINEELLEANAVKDRFFSVVAHDLRGPIFGIASYTAGLLDSDATLDFDEAIGSLATVRDTAVGLQQVLEHLLEWGDLQRSSEPVELQTVRVTDMLGTAVDSFRGLIETKQLSVDIESSDDLYASAAPHLLSGIVQNLLHNAIKFTPVRGRIIMGAVRERVPGMVSIDIIDNGIGMTARQVEAIHQHKAGSTVGTEGEKGSGLGLLLCMEQVKLLGGGLHIHSRVDQGTRVTITVPLDTHVP